MSLQCIGQNVCEPWLNLFKYYFSFSSKNGNVFSLLCPCTEDNAVKQSSSHRSAKRLNSQYYSAVRTEDGDDTPPEHVNMITVSFSKNSFQKFAFSCPQNPVVVSKTSKTQKVSYFELKCCRVG